MRCDRTSDGSIRQLARIVLIDHSPHVLGSFPE
jgi:hypothetical protein